MLRMNVFTDGRPLGNVKQYDFERGAEKWGGLSICTEAELKAAMPWIEESLTNESTKPSKTTNPPAGTLRPMKAVSQKQLDV